MTKYVSDGIIQTHLVVGLDDKDNPALSEIQGGTDLTEFMRSIDTPFEGSTVDAATADSGYNSTVAGTFGGQPVTAEFVRHLLYADDVAWTTLTFRLNAHLIVARRGGTGALGVLQAGDHVDVIPIDITSRNPAAYGRNELSRFMLTAAVPDEPVFDAVIVAS